MSECTTDACLGGGAAAEAEVMSYTGVSAGSYVQETSYKYVGEGAGDFQAVKIGGKRNWCPLISAICAALLALMLFMLLMTPTPTTTTTTLHVVPTHAPAPVPVPITLAPTPAPTPPPTTQPPPPPPPTPAPTPAPLNECEIGGVDTWSPALRAHCCQVYGNGCPTPAPTPAPVPIHDCSADYDQWQAAWSPDRKDWCCRHENKGCAFEFHCNIDLHHAVHDWSPEKKDWCCEHESLGCPDGHGGVTGDGIRGDPMH